MATHYEAEKPKGKNRLKVVRKVNARSNTTNTHTINADMDWCIISNETDVNLKFCFKSDDILTDWFELAPGEKSPAFGVSRDTDINYRSVSGNSKEFALILWA